MERFAANQLSGLTIIDGLNFTGSEDEEEWNDKNESTGDGEEFEDLTLINLPRPVPIHGPSDEYSDEDSVNDFSLNE